MNTWGNFLYSSIGVLMLGLLFSSIFVFFERTPATAATIITYSDLITSSAPATTSDHTITFRTTAEIPTGGYVRFRPNPGAFTIPATNFDHNNVQLEVSTSSGFITRTTGTTTGTSTDGVAITSGTSGSVEITLNSNISIPANADIRIKIGRHATSATTTDDRILNPSATGTHPIFIETSGTPDQSVRALVAIIDQVEIPDIDTTETDPPVRFNGAPSGELSGTTVTVEMSLETDEFAKCRYSTASGTAFASMLLEFGPSFATVHAVEVSVATNTAYTFFVRCIDDEGNFNIDDFVISFSIPEFPEGTPGDTGGGEDPGSGSGSGSGSSGSGSGSSGGGGGGSSSGGSSGSGGSGGGGGSSGDEGSGSGGFEGTIQPFQSGDGRVIINGFAFPKSEVVVLVDGFQAETKDADNDGDFSITIDDIARGVYTFGIYAIDANGNKSSTFSTTFTITGARGSTLSNVNIMPSIVVDPDPVDPGQTLSISGFSIPDATVTIENQNDKSSISLKTFTTTSDSDGEWSIEVDTSGFTTGTYKVRAKAKQEFEDGVSTDYSEFTFYGVGEEATLPRTSDLNSDGFVNLIDFSILLFWWNTDGGNSNPPADINNDGVVSLTDFSIMIFNWTG